MPRLPLVGLPADSKPIGLHRYQTVGEKYISAVVEGAVFQDNNVNALFDTGDAPLAPVADHVDEPRLGQRLLQLAHLADVPRR